ncbi:MAG: hypothetical protein R6V07_01830 [Armatimonadota bacterium]
MRHLTVVAALLVGCCVGVWGQDMDADGLPDAVEARLGTDPSTPESMTLVYEDGPEEDAELDLAHDLLTVHVASLGTGRTLWRLQFTEPWEERGDVALIVYIDADNDPETGRQGGGVQGTDIMLRPDQLSNHGLAASPVMVSAAHGDSLYLTLDAPLNIDGDELAFRAYVLIQNRENTADADRTPWFEVRAPASRNAPVAVPEAHPLYRPPETLERVRVRVPIDDGGRRAIVTWITSWPARADLQFGEPGRLDEVIRGESYEQNHRVVLDALAPDREYAVRVRARGATGELLSSEEVRFSTAVSEPGGDVMREQVPLRVTGAPGDRRPVSQGVPFPQGALGSADHARVLDAAGAEVPAQIDVTSRWPDGTVKWVLLDFQADIPETRQVQYALEFGTEVTRAPVADSVDVNDAEDAVVVDTGALKVRLDRADFAFLGEAWLDADGDGAYSSEERVTETDGAGIVLTDLDGEQFNSLGAPEMLAVTREGPLHAVVTARGPHRSASGKTLFRYEVRMHFYAGLPVVRVFHTFENDRSDELFTTIRSLDVRVPVAGGVEAARIATEGGAQSISPGERLLQRDDAGDRPPGSMTVAGRNASTTVAVRNFWRLWPKSLGVDSTAAVIGILPELAEDTYDDIDPDLEDRIYYAMVDGTYKLHRGVSKTHEFTVHFTPESPDTERAAELTDSPALAAAPPRWYADSKAFWHITPRVDGEFERYEAFVDEILQAFLRKREENREFGMFNFGDWWGERGFNWGNIEYDTQHGMMMQFARTGEREWFENAMWAARHNIDVDIVQHGWSGHPAGAPFSHAMCHTGDYYPDSDRPSGTFRGGWNTGHLWTRGNLEYALMTGDQRARRIALQTADYLAGDLMVGYRMNKGAERSTAWPLFAVMAAYHATADEYYLNAARIITREVIREQNPDEGHWDIPAGYSDVKPTPIGGYAWCTGLLLTSLEMANEYLHDPEIDRTLVKAARWLVEEEWQPDRRGFRSASCDSLNAAARPGSNCRRTPAALLRAYELTGDETFREIAHMGFAYVAAGSGGSGKGGSTQLTLSPHIIYKLKQAGITSLDTGAWESPVRLEAGFVPVEPGEPVMLPVTVASNRDRTLSVSLRVEDLPRGWPPVDAQAVELPPGEEAAIAFRLPAASGPDGEGLERGEMVALTIIGEIDGDEATRRRVVLGCSPEGRNGDAIGLIADGQDFLGPALDRVGVQTRRIEALTDLSAFELIFLGTQAHAVDAAGLQEDYARLLQWVHGGGTLVVSQLNDDNWRQEFLPGSVILAEPNATSGKIVAPDHPIFAGIPDPDALAGMVMYDSIVEAQGWQVLLEDTSGKPAIATTEFGAGRILTVMPSVERYYTGEASAADAGRLADYQALFENIVTWALTAQSQGGAVGSG